MICDVYINRKISLIRNYVYRFLMIPYELNFLIIILFDWITQPETLKRSNRDLMLSFFLEVHTQLWIVIIIHRCSYLYDHGRTTFWTSRPWQSLSIYLTPGNFISFLVQSEPYHINFTSYTFVIALSLHTITSTIIIIRVRDDLS